MKIELAEDYEEKIFRSVMERRKKAQKIRKRVLCVVIIFTCLFGITTMSYSKFKKENYDNYFISNSENQLIEDEYEYFNDLGLKLNFINYAEDSIIIGFNIKYDDIANKNVFIEKIKVEDLGNKRIIYNKVDDILNIDDLDTLRIDKYIKEKNEIIYIIQIDKKETESVKTIGMDIEMIKIADEKDSNVYEINWEKIIEKEKE